MKVSEYVEAYTDGYRFHFYESLIEFWEWVREAVRWNRKGMREEWQDTLHFFQLWLFWRFKVNGEIWQCTMESVNKFMGRVATWRKLYAYAGLDPMVSNFAGNYNKLPKVIKQLGKFGVSEAKATEAYNAIILHKV